MIEWRGARAGITGMAVAVCVGLTGARHALAGEGDAQRRWQSPDALIHTGQLTTPIAILEVDFQYDADANPSLQVKNTTIKHGYAPQYEPLSSGYVLSLHAENGDTLASLTFQIPNTVFNPPPLSGEAADGAPVVLRQMAFSLTVPMIDGAVEARVIDPQGLLIAQESLRTTPVEHNAPNFHSLPHGPSPSSSWWHPIRTKLAALVDSLMETAEAAGTSLDITFVGDNYTAADLTMFHQDVDRAINHLLTYEPYASRASQVLFHAVDNSTTDLGCVHNATMDRLITCNNTTVTSVVNSAGAPYDKLIVLVNDPNYGGSGGAIAVSYTGGYAPQVVVHEFGHTLGGLLDEYNLYTTNGTLDSQPHVNCFAGTPPASSWDGIVPLSDYALGCNYPNWYRPSPCSIMLSLSCEYFNPVSKNQLNARIDLYAGSLSPSLTLSANPTVIGLGGSSTLSWSGSNVTSCTASGAWSGAKPTSGSETVIPAATSTYTLACSSGSGSVTQSITITVDTSAPSVSLTAPSDGATVSGTVSLSASATDNLEVSRVDFFKDGALLGSDNSAPYSVSWNAGGDTPGAHTLTVDAVDRAGNLGVSSPVAVTVGTVQDTQAPQVAITSPADGTKLISAKTKTAASASDNVGVTRLELYVDGLLTSSSTTGSVSLNWDTRKLSIGPHTIATKAFDAAGNLGTTSITVYK